MADDYLTIRDKNRAKTGALMERSGYRPVPEAPEGAAVNDLGLSSMSMKNAAFIAPAAKDIRATQIMNDRLDREYAARDQTKGTKK